MATISDSLIENTFSWDGKSTYKPHDKNITRTYYEQGKPNVKYTDDDFLGPIEIPFNVPTNCEWIPSRSFLAVNDEIKTISGGQPRAPKHSDSHAPSWNTVACLFNAMKVQYNDNTIDEIPDHYAQVSAYRVRTRRGKSFLNGLGQVLDLKPSFEERLNDISSDGWKTPAAPLELYNLPIKTLTGTITTATDSSTVTGSGGSSFSTQVKSGDYVKTNGEKIYRVIEAKGDDFTIDCVPKTEEKGVAVSVILHGSPTRRTYNNERLHIPACGIFDVEEYFEEGQALPAGAYKLILTVNSNYKKAVLNTLVDKTAGTDFTYAVKNLKFYACITEYYTTPTKTFYRIPTKQVKVRSVTLNHADEKTRTEKTVNIDANTHKIGIAIQDYRAGNNTIYSPTIFRGEGDVERNLTTLSVKYAGQTKPSSDRTMELSSTTDKYMLSYLDSALATEQFDHSHTAPMSYDDWLRLGPLLVFQYQNRSETEGTKSTTADINVSLSAITAPSVNILVFNEMYNTIALGVPKQAPQTVLKQIV